MADERRLDQQIAFIREMDALKNIIRQTWLTDQSRRENSAEHSWHLATMALLLQEYAAETVDVARVIQMALVHDLVEIDAGDTFVYDAVGEQDKAEREQRAADRLFGLLPEDQHKEIRELWEEFEARETAEARFAAALDRLQPILHNFWTQGRAWRAHGITARQVRQSNCHMADGSPQLWQFVERLIEQAVANGYLAE